MSDPNKAAVAVGAAAGVGYIGILLAPCCFKAGLILLVLACLLKYLAS